MIIIETINLKPYRVGLERFHCSSDSSVNPLLCWLVSKQAAGPQMEEFVIDSTMLYNGQLWGICKKLWLLQKKES